jgi:hypothetical protein
MLITSNYTNLPASITGRGKRGLFALGEVAQKKLYTAEHIPSSPGEWGLIFALLPLPHAGAEIPPSLPGMAHSATVRASRHLTTGSAQRPHRATAWTPSARDLLHSGDENIQEFQVWPHWPAKYQGEWPQ